MEIFSRKAILTFSTLILISFFSFAQETQTPPAYLDCQNFKGEKRKACTIEKIQEFVKENVDRNYLGFKHKTPHPFYCRLTVNKKGGVENIDAIGANVSGIEVRAVLKKLPKLFPARKNGKSVSYDLSFSVVFNENKRPNFDDHSNFPECEGGSREEITACEFKKLQGYIKAHIDKEKFNQSKYGRLLFVRFWINETGKIWKVQSKGASGSVEEEVERIIKDIAQVKPAKRDGKNIKSVYSFPVYLKIKSKYVKEDVDIVPTYPGCPYSTNKMRRKWMNKKIHGFLGVHFNRKNVHFKKSGIYKAYAKFVIDTDGKIIAIETYSIYPDLAKEAKRILKRLPKMEPGKKDGTFVEVSYKIPISLKFEK